MIQHFKILTSILIIQLLLACSYSSNKENNKIKVSVSASPLRQKKTPRQILVQIDGVLKYQILLSPLIRKQVSHLFVGHGLVFCQVLYHIFEIRKGIHIVQSA